MLGTRNRSGERRTGALNLLQAAEQKAGGRCVGAVDPQRTVGDVR